MAGCVLLFLVGAWWRRPDLILGGMLLLALAWLPPLWRRRSLPGLAGWLVFVGGTLAAVAMGKSGWVLMALPVVFPGALAWLFARSLRGGREPLVSRMVRITEGDMQLEQPGVRAYTRGVTVYWVVLLMLFALSAFVVALFARPGGWLAALGVSSWITLPGAWLVWYPEAGCGAWLVVGFVGEYLFRRWYLRTIVHPGPVRFVVRLARSWPRVLQEGTPRA